MGINIRTIPYIIAIGFNFSQPMLVFIYILSGLVIAVIALALMRLFYNFVIRSARGLRFISVNNFIAVLSVALIFANLLTGAVFWSCYAFPLMYPLVVSIADLILGTPCFILAYFYLKKAFIPPHLHSKVFITLAVPYAIYHVVLVIGALV